MPSPVRVGASPGVLRGRGVAPQQAYSGTTSVYGASRGDSIGANPKNPNAFLASTGAKAYPGKATMTIPKPSKSFVPETSNE